MKSIVIATLIAALAQGVSLPALAAEFNDKALQTQFENGALRLEYSMFGKGVWGGDELNRLYREQRWPELVEGVVSRRFVSDLYYFYVGAAAEALGRPDAAAVYYRMSLAAFRRGDTCRVGIDSCRGIIMPETVAGRLATLEGAEKPSTRVVKAVSGQSTPLAGVRVSATGNRKGTACVTDDNGTCRLDLMLKRDEALNIALSKPGMFDARATVPGDAQEQTVTMRAFEDMMCADLRADAVTGRKASLERRVELIDVLARLEGATLEEGGICTSTFKKNSYLSFKLKNQTAFNENKLTNYMIGTMVFDDVARKMLLAMAASAAELKVDGYDISVSSTKGNFSDGTVPPKPVDFRFYFPKQLVAKYQDKDISGQQLLDGSVILLNDDRVELKLQ